MSDIARAAGVGKATVSLALRNDPRLRAETRRKVRAVAEEMGYRRNAVVANLMAQLRASRDPKFQATLAVLNAADSHDALRRNSTFRQWLEGLSRRAAQLGYALDEFWIRDPALEPARLRQILRARGIKGALIAGVLENRELEEKFNLLWEELACVVVGIRPERPALHFACNDQFSTALHAAEELARRGYERPALVIAEEIEANIDYRFSAGFAAGPPKFAGRPSVWRALGSGKAGLAKWMGRHEPDVIVTTHVEIREWLRELGRECALVHLDIAAGMEGWTGMNQHNDLVGVFAIDLLVGQLHRNEFGIPDHPRCMMVESEWVEGATCPNLMGSRVRRRRRG